ncbi:MAG: endonuclease III [Phycisphaerales bacterium]|nr:endonuclease III [Phycisphaerales bacterium]
MSAKRHIEPTRRTESEKRRARRLWAALSELHPDAHCELEYAAPHELLFAVILSAQTTDVAVNKATPALFEAFPQVADYAAAGPEGIEPYIRSIGLFRNKAKSLAMCAQQLIDHHGGEVPDDFAALLDLRGVARKTANCVLGEIFGRTEGVVVDTHVMRLSQRLGLTSATRPDAIEADLMGLFPPSRRPMLAHLLIFHGRRFCPARGPHIDNPVCSRFAVSPCRPIPAGNAQ